MEKGKLEELLNDFTENQNLSADLYFIYKTANGSYDPFVTKPDPALKKDIIESFTKELIRFGDPSSVFELHPVLTDNENPGYYIYFDNLDSTIISKEIFSSNLSNAVEYDSNKGEFSKIFGFLINIYNGTSGKNVLIFKKIFRLKLCLKVKLLELSQETMGVSPR